MSNKYLKGCLDTQLLVCEVGYYIVQSMFGAPIIIVDNTNYCNNLQLITILLFQISIITKITI